MGEEIIKESQRNPEEVSKTLSKSSVKEESVNKPKLRTTQNIRIQPNEALLA